jgi:hypothetical protein
MSIDQRPAASTKAREDGKQQESLKQLAEDFLISVTSTVHAAREEGLEYGGLYNNGEKIVYVSTPTDHVGIIKVAKVEGAEVFTLKPSIEGGLYSHSSDTYYECIQAVDKATHLRVEMHGYPSTHSYGVHTEIVSDLAKASVIEEFASSLKPVSKEIFSQLLDEQSRYLRARDKVSIGKKIGRLLGRKNSH